MTANASNNDPDPGHWQAAKSRSGSFGDGDPCNEFIDCSLITKLIAASLWDHWKLCNSEVRFSGLSADAIDVRGENLVDAVLECFQVTGSGSNDVAQVARAMTELESVGLVIQRDPGRWEIRFGEPFTADEIGRNRARRANARSLGNKPKGTGAPVASVRT